ncbi:cytochrome P450 [Peniophora sp. CONT]|nr:cytochrome P450 [Peniophora sp. CONT]
MFKVFSLCVAAALAAVIGTATISRRRKRRALRNLPAPPSPSFITGNLLDLYTEGALPLHAKLTEQYGGVIKYDALFKDVQLWISDPLAIQHIVQRDQHMFEETDFFIAACRQMVGPGILSSTGLAHRRQRKIFSSVFSTANLRNLVPVFRTLSLEVCAVLKKMIEDDRERDIDVLDWGSRIAFEAVCQATVGHSFDAIHDPVGHPYCRALKDFVPALATLAPFSALTATNVHKLPDSILHVLGRLTPHPGLHKLMDVSNVMHSTAKGIWEEKDRKLAQGDAAVVEQIGQGKDLLSVLWKANKAASKEDRLSEEEIIAQIGTMIFAGTDTTSGALARTFDLLGQHPDVQDKLREEVKGWENMSYEEIIALPYIDAVCRETLRLYAPAQIVPRVVKGDVVVPLSKPITGVDGNAIESLFLPQGLEFFVHVAGSNTNPDIWGADAHVWRPERWFEPLPESVAAAHLPAVFGKGVMTFYGGGRACIGMQFSQLEMKMVIAALTSAFRFEPSQKEEVEWRFANIIAPSVKGAPERSPKLPMKLSVV